jgi:polyisoprenoid-binding protein YceI
MSTTLQQVPAGTFVVDPVHSNFGFAVTYSKLAKFQSTFGHVEASLDDGVLTGSAEVSSINIEEPNLKGHVLSADFFDAEQTPTIAFRSADIRALQDGQVEVDGELTIRGVTKPVLATGTYATGTDLRGNERVAFELETTVDRRDFGLSWQMELPGGGEALGWDVTISVQLQLFKQA